MSIRLTGQLLSPTDGSPAANGQIRFISLQGTGKVPKGAIAIEAADANGDYDFTLEFGRFSVEIRQADKFVKQGAVLVNADTPTPLEIGGLLEYTEPLTPGQIIYVEQLTAQAEAAAQAANASQSAANSSAMAASNSAAEAKSEADRASEISGLDTVEEAIDLTLAKTLGLMTETEAMAQADAYEQMFAASGMVHSGVNGVASGSVGVINEGLWTWRSDTVPNSIFQGKSGDVSEGTSKTEFPVSYIAGAIMNIMSVDVTIKKQSIYTLPPAEAGTRVYDSTGDARGSGQATLDFRYDNDPKYGNAPSGTEAEILREAVSRAFEGHLKNGDFREDNNYWVPDSKWSISNGVAQFDGSAAGDCSSLNQLNTVSGIEYEVQFEVVGSAAGFVCDFKYNNATLVSVRDTDGDGVYTARFTSVAGATFRIYGNYAAYGIANVSARPLTEEVVTHRSDVATWESYDEELTGRKEIMECIQSLSTTFGDTDVPTVLSTRPLSYFQQYDGQFADPDVQNDRYRCVVWDDLTDEQKSKVAAYMGNKLYVGENGNLVNRRLRARTFRGLGNGDWENIDSVNPVNFLQAQGSNYVQAHGALDSVAMGSSLDSNTTSVFVGINSPLSSYKKSKGAFALRDTAGFGRAYKGRCLLYVVASVPRANQGAYVKGLNEFGTAQLAFDQGGAGTVNNGTYWYSGSLKESLKPKTLKECFGDWLRLGQPLTKPSRYVHFSTTFFNSGTIGSGRSGHPDGIFYDGITAGGLSGVIDWRLPAVANDTPEEQSKVQGKVENKTFRGLEKLVTWCPIRTTYSSAVRVYFYSDSPDFVVYTSWGNNEGYGLNLNDPVWVTSSDTGNTYAGVISQVTTGFVRVRGVTGLIPTDEGETAAVQIDSIAWSANTVSVKAINNPSVSGEFNTSMVIGDPVNILQTDALKDGWLGTWCPVIPDGTSKEIPLSRKNIGAVPSTVYTSDNGATWGAGSRGNFDFVKNSDTVGFGGTEVQIWNYTAYAKVTEPCENKPVYNGKKGLMPVFVGSHSDTFRGCTFQESLIGKVGKNNLSANVGKHTANLAIEDIYFDLSEGKLSGAVFGKPEHAPITLSKPNNDSPAVKVLPYQISENEQCFIGYQANELIWTNPTFTIVPETNTTWTLGTFYHVNTGAWRGKYYCRRALGLSLTAPNLYRDSSGNVVIEEGIVYLTYMGTSDDGSWGDDDKIKVTADGSDTFVDLNGKTNLSVSHKTTMPTGWTKNRARIGEQVEGVDL